MIASQFIGKKKVLLYLELGTLAANAMLKQLDGAEPGLGRQATGAGHEHHRPAVVSVACIGAEEVVVVDLDQGRPQDDISVLILRVLDRSSDGVRRMTVELPI